MIQNVFFSLYYWKIYLLCVGKMHSPPPGSLQLSFSLKLSKYVYLEAPTHHKVTCLSDVTESNGICFLLP